MKKGGILHAQLMGELSKLRHTDKLVICDAGFPIPQDANMVDVSLIAGLPSFMQVLKAILNEVIFEEYAIFDIMKTPNPEYYEEVTSLLKTQKSSEVSFDEFISMASDAKLFVRTSELKPCSNILLVSASGVPKMCDQHNVVCE